VAGPRRSHGPLRGLPRGFRERYASSNLHFSPILCSINCLGGDWQNRWLDGCERCSVLSDLPPARGCNLYILSSHLQPLLFYICRPSSNANRSGDRNDPVSGLLLSQCWTGNAPLLLSPTHPRNFYSLGFLVWHDDKHPHDFVAQDSNPINCTAE
jgi:hypothetical protein